MDNPSWRLLNRSKCSQLSHGQSRVLCRFEMCMRHRHRVAVAVARPTQKGNALSVHPTFVASCTSHTSSALSSPLSLKPVTERDPQLDEFLFLSQEDGIPNSENLRESVRSYGREMADDVGFSNRLSHLRDGLQSSCSSILVSFSDFAS